MTLIITAATKNFVFQVADTQLTNINGTFFSDKLVKATIVHCRDAKIAVSYTGLAIIKGERTDKWIVAKLIPFKPWEKVFVEVVDFLKTELTKANSYEPNLKKYGLTLVMGGMGKNKFGLKDTAIALVTNNEEPIPQKFLLSHVTPKAEFSRHIFNTGDHFTWYMSVHGAVDMNNEINSLRRKIGSKLLEAKTNKQLDEIMNYLVAWLRLQRKSKRVGHLIGDDCTVVRIGNDFKGSLFFIVMIKRKKGLQIL